jgi:hypothetical protein
MQVSLCIPGPRLYYPHCLQCFSRLTFVSLNFLRAMSTNSSDTGALRPLKASASINIRISFLSRKSEKPSLGSSTKRILKVLGCE